MTLIWKPLCPKPGVDLDTLLADVSAVTHESEAVLIAFVRGHGWCGCYASASLPGEPDEPRTIHLMNVGDVAIIAVRRPSDPIILH